MLSRVALCDPDNVNSRSSSLFAKYILMANRAHEYLVVVDVHAISSAQRTITLRLDREISTFNDLRSLVASRSGGVASFIVLRAVIHEYKSGEPL